MNDPIISILPTPKEIEAARRNTPEEIDAWAKSIAKQERAEPIPGEQPLQLTDAEMNEKYKAPVGDTEKDKVHRPFVPSLDAAMEKISILEKEITMIKHEMMCQRASDDKRSSNEKQPRYITNPMRPGPLMAMPPLYPPQGYPREMPSAYMTPQLHPFMFGQRQEPQVYTTGNIYQRHETGAPFGQNNQMPKDPIVDETISQEVMKQSFIDNSVAVAKSHKEEAKLALHEAVTRAFYRMGNNGLVTIGSFARLVKVHSNYHVDIRNDDRVSKEIIPATQSVDGSGIMADINNIVDRLFLHL